MKTISTTLTALFTVAALFDIGCAAQTGDASATTIDEAQYNNGGGPTGPSLDDLLDAGYHCVATNIPATPLACGKDGGDGNVYFCNPETRQCVPAPTNPKITTPIIVIQRPVIGPIKASQ